MKLRYTPGIYLFSIFYNRAKVVAKSNTHFVLLVFVRKDTFKWGYFIRL